MSGSVRTSTPAKIGKCLSGLVQRGIQRCIREGATQRESDPFCATALDQVVVDERDRRRHLRPARVRDGARGPHSLHGRYRAVMPETRLERALFLLGLVAMAALAFAIARSWHRSAILAAPAATARVQRTATAPHRVAGPTGSEAASIAPERAVSLALTASRATWVEVRSRSATGAILYTGTLESGATKRFRDSIIWVRFGAASNLGAQLNGQRLRLPAGTYDALFDTTGFRRARG